MPKADYVDTAPPHPLQSLIVYHKIDILWPTPGTPQYEQLPREIFTKIKRHQPTSLSRCASDTEALAQSIERGVPVVGQSQVGKGSRWLHPLVRQVVDGHHAACVSVHPVPSAMEYLNLCIHLLIHIYLLSVIYYIMRLYTPLLFTILLLSYLYFQNLRRCDSISNQLTSSRLLPGWVQCDGKFWTCCLITHNTPALDSGRWQYKLLNISWILDLTVVFKSLKPLLGE